MILYGNSMSPFVRKTMAFATEKGLNLELKAAGLGSTDPDFLRASPFRKMPGFSDGDFHISDSTAIITYLEASHPEPNLIPLEPKARARTVWYEEFADTILAATLAKTFFNRIVSPRFLGRPGDLEAADKAEREEAPPLFAYLEGLIPASGFLVEDRLTLADLAVASPFVNYEHAGCKVDTGAYPKTVAYVDAILGRPSFAPIVARERKFFAAA